MLDLNFIRENPDQIKEALVKLNTDAPIDEILALDEERRGLLTEVEALKHQRNVTSEKIGRMGKGEDRQALITEMRQVGQRVKALDGQVSGVEQRLREAMLLAPNMPHETVPIGKADSENVVVRTEGKPREFDFEPLPHWDLGPELGIIDFERGVKLSGTRFYLLKGLGARLQRALIAWMSSTPPPKSSREPVPGRPNPSWTKRWMPQRLRFRIGRRCPWRSAVRHSAKWPKSSWPMRMNSVRFLPESRANR